MAAAVEKLSHAKGIIQLMPGFKPPSKPSRKSEYPVKLIDLLHGLKKLRTFKEVLRCALPSFPGINLVISAFFNCSFAILLLLEKRFDVKNVLMAKLVSLPRILLVINKV